MTRTLQDESKGFPDESYMPEYLMLMASLFTPEMVPQSGHMRPNETWDVNTDPFEGKPAWLISLMSLHLPIQIVVRAGYLAEAAKRNWETLEKRDKQRIHDSIDYLTLANQATFSFMNEHWQITEADVSKRMSEIFAAEFDDYVELIKDDAAS